MAGTAIGLSKSNFDIRYCDQGVFTWLWTQAPCAWQEKTTIEFREVSLGELQGATSGKNPATVARYVEAIERGKNFAPLVVCTTGHGTYYVHDGNHRLRALRSVADEEGLDLRVRVAVVVPKQGYVFQWRWFRTYGTYVLEPEGMYRYRPISDRARYRAELQPLLGRTLVLLAHPDDETGGCTALIQRVREPIVVFATDGAPKDEFFWKAYGSQDRYRRIRKQEARCSLAGLGISNVHFLDEFMGATGTFPDQELHERLSPALSALLAIVRRYRPHAILVPAYEGGHPDHDACSFLGALAGELAATPVWEMPLYHRDARGRLVCRRFRELNGTEIKIRLTTNELVNRSIMIANYSSQTDLGSFIDSNVERFRPQPQYDYTRRPHDGPANYEAWGWPITAERVCKNFRECMSQARPLVGEPVSTAVSEIDYSLLTEQLQTSELQP